MARSNYRYSGIFSPTKLKLNFLVFCTLVVIIGCKQPIKSVALQGFNYSNVESVPVISVHRGGKDLFGYPENCLETMTYVNDSIKAIFEVDVAQTKDGKLVLMHDNSINRTTTGQGLVRKINYEELSELHLVDDYGNVTDFNVPLFSEVLQWATTNEVVLTVDVKRSANQTKVIKAIQNIRAQDVCILITYDIGQAKAAYKQAPELMLSVPARNSLELQRLLTSGIPKENMIVFSGTRLSSTEHYTAIHGKGMLCILGTLGNLDRQAKARGDDQYLKWKNLGIDIFATDRPFEAYKILTKSKSQ